MHGLINECPQIARICVKGTVYQVHGHGSLLTGYFDLVLFAVTIDIIAMQHRDDDTVRALLQLLDEQSRATFIQVDHIEWVKVKVLGKLI